MRGHFVLLGSCCCAKMEMISLSLTILSDRDVFFLASGGMVFYYDILL